MHIFDYNRTIIEIMENESLKFSFLYLIIINNRFLTENSNFKRLQPRI
jgi:hypothetical protein